MLRKKSGDAHNSVQSTMVHPLKPVFSFNDLLQVIIGASVLAVPVGFTEETWELGSSLPLLNVTGILLLTIFFISMFTYFHYHRTTEREHLNEFIKRVGLTYIFAFAVVALILTLIQRAPWTTDFSLALQRVIIITFPSSLSGAIADTFR